MDEKLKSEKMQKEQFSMFVLYFESNQGRHIFIQICFRMHHFVVKFSKKIGSGGKGALTP